METKQTSIFQKIILVTIALCTVAIVALMTYQVIIGQEKVSTLETNLLKAEEQLSAYEGQLSTYESELIQYKNQIEELINKEDATPKYAVSSTKEYAAWIAAQSALEPYDLYDDLQYAYEQLADLDSDYMIGTEVYKAAVNLLIPKKSQDDVSAYLKTLKRYFGVSDVYTIRSRFIDDLVSVKLLTSEGNNSYSWNQSTLTTKNVMSKLNLTEDVANALLGMLNTMDWGV